MEGFDSTEEINKHIENVYKILKGASDKLIWRGMHHDVSKLEPPEKEANDIWVPKLENSTYGSEEYKNFLKEMKPALDHHYKLNKHHPEHFKDGILDMTLLDLLEMLADWKAATLRHKDGSLKRSFEINSKRFNIPESLLKILVNTAEELELMDKES